MSDAKPLLLSPGALWPEMVEPLRALPAGALTKADLLVDRFLMAREGRLSVYWIPFERLNRDARLVIVGLTPGWTQMCEAFTAARDAMADGFDATDVLAYVKRQASFVGLMRTNMVGMLDALGLATALSIRSTADLFASGDALVHSTSALRYPVFVDGRNYAGTNPPVRRSVLLTGMVKRFLEPELAEIADALVLPLGRATEDCLHILVEAGALDPGRCLFGFPHPSGANGHRVRQFKQNELRLSVEIATWAQMRAC